MLWSHLGFEASVGAVDRWAPLATSVVVAAACPGLVSGTGAFLWLHTDASDFRTIFDTIPSDFHTIIFKCDWCWNKKEQLLMVRGDAQNTMYVLLDVPDLGERIIV